MVAAPVQLRKVIVAERLGGQQGSDQVPVVGDSVELRFLILV
jgi:hypothetical protein